MRLLLNDLEDGFAQRFALWAGAPTDGMGTGGGGGDGAPAGDSGPGAGEGQPPAAPSALTEEAVSGLIEKALKPYQDRIADLQSTNVILQGMMRERATPSVAEPTEPVEPPLPDKDKFIEEMNADPAGTILKLINERVVPKIEKRVSGVKSETQQEQQQRQNLERAINQDQSAALEIASSWTDGSPERDLFDQYGEEELGRLCPSVIINGKKMPDPRVFRPGMLEQAALRAERRLRAEGKAPSAASAAPAANSRVVQFPRATPKSSAGAPSGAAGAPPKTIDDLVSSGKLTASEATIAKTNCRKWGMSEESYVKNWIEVERENPHYGTGL